MDKYVKKPVEIEAITFDELIKNEHGKPIELEYNDILSKDMMMITISFQH